MSRIGFPLKDLRRRKFRVVFSFASLTLCVASMISTVLIAQSHGLRLAAILSDGFSVGFIDVFSGFATVVTYLSLITGGVMTYFFVSAEMKARVRDVGIIRAVGCVPDQAFGYFVSQLGLLVLSSCVAGAGIGVLVSYVLTYLNPKNVVASQVSINVWTILGILLIFALVAFVLGIQPIAAAMKVKPAEALFPYYLREVSPKSARSSLTKLSTSLKIAYRSLMRRKTVTLSTVLCLSLALAAMTVAQAGTAIAGETSQAYLREGLGENFVLIGDKDITRQYLYFLSQPFQKENKPAISYLDLRYTISEMLIRDLAAIPSVRVDPRLFLESQVDERPTIHIVEERYFVIGDSRFSDAVVFGVDPERVVNNWLIQGRTFNGSDKYSAILGDSLAQKILTSPLEQRVTVLGSDFDVVGVALDPLNAGLVAYLPLNGLTLGANETSCNLVVAKIDSSTYMEALERMRQAVNGTGLQLVELNPILHEYEGFFGSIWSSFSVVSLLFLIIVAVCLFTQITLHVTEQESELAIMRALGAKPRRIVAIVMMQGAIITLFSGVVGIATGILISFVFLIPSPVVSQVQLLTAGLWLLLAVGFLLASSLYPAVRIARKNLASILPKVTL